MKMLRLAALLGVLGGLTATDGGDLWAKSSKTNHLHDVHGIIDHVHQGKKPGHGEFSVRVHHAKGKNKGAGQAEKKFHVNEATKFVVKQGKERRAVNFQALQQGEHVVIHHHADHPHLATLVEIHVKMVAKK